jgi:tetratricopeptide (TPR) repeat protein
MSSGFGLALLVVALAASSADAIAQEVLGPEQYANAAMKAQEQGDWQSAVRFWARARAAVESESDNLRTAAIVAYEYGRALGVVCEFADSERLLLAALALDERIAGPRHMPLIELARLKFDQKLYADSISYFEQAVAELDRMNASHRDPDGFAHFLEEYAQALDGAGLAEQSRIVATRAERLRMHHRHHHGGAAARRTPFGTQCRTS